MTGAKRAPRKDKDLGPCLRSQSGNREGWLRNVNVLTDLQGRQESLGGV